MGFSATADICFGVEIDSFRDLPWTQDDYIDIDSDGEEWWRVQQGFDAQRYPLDHTNDEVWQASWAARQEWDKTHEALPFKVLFHGNAADNRCPRSTVIVAMAGTDRTAWCGVAERIDQDFFNLGARSTEKIKEFKAFLAKYNISTDEPDWFLLSCFG